MFVYTWANVALTGGRVHGMQLQELAAKGAPQPSGVLASLSNAIRQLAGHGRHAPAAQSGARIALNGAHVMAFFFFAFAQLQGPWYGSLRKWGDRVFYCAPDYMRCRRLGRAVGGG